MHTTQQTGVYALMDERILRSRVTRLQGEGRRASMVGWVEGSGGNSEPDRAGRRPSYSGVGFFYLQ